jgi:hypothetical protein
MAQLQYLVAGSIDTHKNAERVRTKLLKLKHVHSVSLYLYGNFVFIINCDEEIKTGYARKPIQEGIFDSFFKYLKEEGLRLTQGDIMTTLALQ